MAPFSANGMWCSFPASGRSPPVSAGSLVVDCPATDLRSPQLVCCVMDGSLSPEEKLTSIVDCCIVGSNVGINSDSLSLHCELFVESSNSQGADSISNIFSWISCRGFNQGIRPTPRTATQSPWLRGSWLPSGNWGKWLDAQGEGTICGLFIFYWTLSTSNLRVISV